MKTSVIFFTFYLLASAHAETLSFESIWNKVKSESPAISKEEHQVKASQLASSRAEMHWLPSISLGAKAFSTNDPTTIFFSNLSQRQVSATDFAISNLNEPGSQTFETLSLGLDLPLYEGGRKTAESNAISVLYKAAQSNQKAAILNEYVDIAKTYSQLTALTLAGERLKVLSDRVIEILSKYSIGTQSNPVGYSGMLGLKSLKNRIEGELISLQSKENNYREMLIEKAKIEYKSWAVVNEETLSFLNRIMPLSNDTKPSYSEVSAIALSEAMDKMKIAEKSRFLPRIGLFANEGVTYGARDTGSSFTGGAYLQWSLFNPDNVNRVDEKNEMKLTANSTAQEIKQNGNISRKALQQNEASTKRNIELLLDSEKLLSEQVKVTSRLFQSGSISALQLVEVLNRRVDLILNLAHMEQEIVEIRAKHLLLTQADGVAL